MRNILCLDLRSFTVLGLVLALFFSLSNLCHSQEVEYFKCPSYEIPIPEESPEGVDCQTCEINSNHPNFSCFSATAIGNGTAFPKSSDIGPFITGNVCMVGSFLVDEPFTFQDAIVRVCNTNNSITVHGNPLGLGLTIDHSEFFSCVGLWEGIQMRQNSSVFTRNNSKIEDAK